MAHKNNVDLGESFNESIGMPTKTEKNKKHYPTLHISNKDLPIDENDVGKEMIAVVKVKIKRVSTRKDESKKTKDHVLEVRSINLNPGKIPHYST